MEHLFLWVNPNWPGCFEFRLSTCSIKDPYPTESVLIPLFFTVVFTHKHLQGNEMCIKPAEFYLYDQEELCFYDIMIRGRGRQEIIIGYRLATAERAIINPVDKSKLVKWSLDDVFVVIAMGEWLWLLSLGHCDSHSIVNTSQKCHKRGSCDPFFGISPVFTFG